MYLQTITMDDATKAPLQARLLQLPSPYENFETFYLKVQQLFRGLLPFGIQRTLVRFQLDPTAPGALYIPTGLCDPMVPKTPSEGGRARDKTTFLSEALAVGFGHFYGEPFGYHNEKQGELFHNIVPVQGSERLSGNRAWQKSRFVRQLAHIPSVEECAIMLKENRSRKIYPSDLTDEQWAIVAPMIPPAKQSKRGGRPRQTPP